MDILQNKWKTEFEPKLAAAKVTCNKAKETYERYAEEVRAIDDEVDDLKSRRDQVRDNKNAL